MDDNDPGIALPIAVAILGFFLVGTVVGLAGVFTGHSETMLLFPGTYLGGVMIWSIIKCTNFHNDRRRPKRPPDAP